MKQVKFITGLMAFGVVSLFAGCGEKENEMTKVTLNEVAHSIFYAPQYVALENGYFTPEESTPVGVFTPESPLSTLAYIPSSCAL